MDEVHFLADRMRGAVWEEVILHLPEDVRLVSLSATVSNAEEFGGWIQTVRGDTTVVVDEHRPVPLWQHMMVGKRLFDLFEGDRAGRPSRHALVDPELLRHISPPARGRPAGGLAAAGPRAAAAVEIMAADRPSTGRRRGPTSSACSTTRACSRRSRSSSPGQAATRRSSSVCVRRCG